MPIANEFKGEIVVASRIVDYLSSGLYESPAACLKELVNNARVGAAFFGSELYKKVIGHEEIDFCGLDRADQEKIIMVMVPKMIAERVHNRGWRVRTERNLRYGGGHHAGMVTWIVKFRWDEDAISEPDATYREALRDILSSAGALTNDGSLLKLC